MFSARVGDKGNWSVSYWKNSNLRPLLKIYKISRTLKIIIVQRPVQNTNIIDILEENNEGSTRKPGPIDWLKFPRNFPLREIIETFQYINNWVLAVFFVFLMCKRSRHSASVNSIHKHNTCAPTSPLIWILCAPIFPQVYCSLINCFLRKIKGYKIVCINLIYLKFVLFNDLIQCPFWARKVSLRVSARLSAKLLARLFESKSLAKSLADSIGSDYMHDSRRDSLRDSFFYACGFNQNHKMSKNNYSQ